MLVTRKINIFPFFFGKAHAEKSVKVTSTSKAQKHGDTTLDELDKRISITKNEDFYKARPFGVTNPFSQLNR